MISHLNFFAPYEGASAWHENQLTRALLVVLRYCPMAHQAWLRLANVKRSLSELSKPEFAVQQQRIFSPDIKITEREIVQGISIWLAPDAAHVSAHMEETERQQVLDGVITYGNDLVIVIENKIGWGAITPQAYQINRHGSSVQFEDEPVPVPWQEVLATLSDLVERDLVSGSERLLIGDFLDLVEEYFPHIGPYSTLMRCGDHRFRLERRLDALLGQVAETGEGKGLGWRNISGTPKIFMAWLGLASDNLSVSLSMYPGDTLGQSRALYGDPAGVDSVLSLQAGGWRVVPNFHWGFTAAGYAWSTTPISVELYCGYWKKEIGVTRQLNRAEWEAYWGKLEAARIVEHAAKQAFDAEFTRSNRQTAQPRPGLFCEYRWSLPMAKELDARGKFIENVRTRINEMLTALHAPLIGSDAARIEAQ